MSSRSFAAAAAAAILVSIDCAAAREPARVRARIVENLSSHAAPVRGDSTDYDTLLELVGDNRFVLLGDATHGTREFYI
ncbi:MAG TPA: hypothetical protein VG106_14770, partial [Vicinamibacterales bacterium]|nr:hypothetical protein [Vicinamibacterales bacterium]